MKRHIFILAAVLAMASCGAPDCPTADYNVIPAPEVSLRHGAFTLSSGLSIGYPEGDAAMERNAAFLAEYVLEMTGKSLTAMPGKGDITLTLDPSAIQGSEAYSINVTRHGVTISGGSPAGVFYGIQTLRKSLPAVIGESGTAPCKEIVLPCGKVYASPRFAYRGVLFDTARHYFSIEYLKSSLKSTSRATCRLPSPPIRSSDAQAVRTK